MYHLWLLAWLKHHSQQVLHYTDSYYTKDEPESEVRERVKTPVQKTKERVCDELLPAREKFLPAAQKTKAKIC